MEKKINEKKQEKRTSCQLKVHTVVITKDWTKYDTSVRVLTYKTVSNSARNWINVNKL